MAMVMMMEACDDTDFGGDDGAADVGNDELHQKHILMRIRSCLKAAHQNSVCCIRNPKILL